MSGIMFDIEIVQSCFVSGFRIDQIGFPTQPRDIEIKMFLGPFLSRRDDELDI